MVPPEQSADLRAYYNKHAKTDRLDSRVLARLPLLHPEGLHMETTLGPGDALKRAVKIRPDWCTDALPRWHGWTRYWKSWGRHGSLLWAAT